jgi:isoleucyl-tRNA synthetase
MTDMTETTDGAAPKGKFAVLEEEVLARWDAEKTFEASLAKESPQGPFTFYDGPPFATGLPHYGHLLQSTIKDAIPRYKTMRGFHVRRRWGWDCHGLPLENQIEEKLGIKTKREIEALGVGQFNYAARNAVMEYADIWKQVIPRLGRWVDMENDYKTLDARYTESVWWSWKRLYDTGLAYEGFKSMHLCPRCGTTLSNFEVNQGYKDIKDIAVTVKLPLLDENGEPTDVSLLVWTTTPWTLPGNMAAAVHRDHEYVRARITTDAGTSRVIVAKAKVDSLGFAYEIEEEMAGAALIGKRYQPPFDYFKNRELEGKEKAWTIYHADYVTLESGTGAVHIAPAYGDDDLKLAQASGIPVTHHVDHDGRFMSFVFDFAGMLVKPKDDDATSTTHLEADIAVVRWLATTGKLLKKENITHSYPHCWRCDTPLLNYATTSWFVAVPKIKDTLIAANNAVKWVPEHIGVSRFGKWLENARDWAVSRQRYWGAPLPVWKHPTTGEVHVLGSLKELTSHTKVSGNTYILMRHGEAESNAKGRSSTKRESPNPLTETGRAQVRASAETLRGRTVDLIVASPFERTRATAEIVAEVLGYEKDAIEYDDRLGEVQLGVLDGSTMEEYHAFIGNASNWGSQSPDGGESWNEVKRRAGSALYELERTVEGKTILIVAHNCPLRMMTAAAHGEALDGVFDHDDEGKIFKNAEVREISFVPLPHNETYELDFHRPFIDEYPVYDSEGTRLTRIPDVFDCWYESGAMPFAQDHYPFENATIVDPEKRIGFPADFIAESVDQTRGWFYSMMVLGTALFGVSPYKHVITNGLMLAEDGKKMSKKLKNYPDPTYMLDKYGADTLRFYMLSSPIIKGEDLSFTEKNVAELSRKNLGRLDNVLSFYNLFKNETAHDAVIQGSPHVLDKWIHSRLHELMVEVTSGYESYELDRATKPVTDFIDDLSTWYVRRSRERVKGEDVEDRAYALGALRYVLRKLAMVIAPAMPFYAEYLFAQVRTQEDPESVHLAAWPTPGPVDDALIEDMNEVRSIVTLALEERIKANIKVRQPLGTLTVSSGRTLSADLVQVIADEVNVKEVAMKHVEAITTEHGEETVARVPVVLDTTITPQLKKEGQIRELMRAIQDMRKEAGLEPKDRVVLTIDTSDEGMALIEQFKTELIRVVGASDVVFGHSDAKAFSIDELSFMVHVQKV